MLYMFFFSMAKTGSNPADITRILSRTGKVYTLIYTLIAL